MAKNDVQQIQDSDDNRVAAAMKSVLDEYEQKFTDDILAAICRSFDQMRADLQAAAEGDPTKTTRGLRKNLPRSLRRMSKRRRSAGKLRKNSAAKRPRQSRKRKLRKRRRRHSANVPSHFAMVGPSRWVRNGGSMSQVSFYALYSDGS